MIDMSVIIWWFPILFMIHEMEEITLIKSWKRSQEKKVVLLNGFMPYKEFVSTESFSIAVLEEFIIILVVTVHAFYTKTYYICTGLFIAVTLHHLIHLLMCLRYRGFVPGVVSSFIILIGSLYLIRYIVIIEEIEILKLSICSTTLAILFFINLKILHKFMSWFDCMLNKTAGGKTVI